jgi:hypothetical protein
MINIVKTQTANGSVFDKAASNRIVWVDCEMTGLVEMP